jgi:hypothetical protein
MREDSSNRLLEDGVKLPSAAAPSRCWKSPIRGREFSRGINTRHSLPRCPTTCSGARDRLHRHVAPGNRDAQVDAGGFAPARDSPECRRDQDDKGREIQVTEKLEALLHAQYAKRRQDCAGVMAPDDLVCYVATKDGQAVPIGTFARSGTTGRSYSGTAKWFVDFDLNERHSRSDTALPEVDLRHCATGLAGQLPRVLGEVSRADVRNVAIWTNKYPRSLRRDEFCRVTTAQMIEKPAAIV